MNSFVIFLITITVFLLNGVWTISNNLKFLDINSFDLQNFSFNLKEFDKLIPETSAFLTDVSSKTKATCQTRCNSTTTTIEDNFYCYCDKLCGMFGDCCYDYWMYCSSSTSGNILNMTTTNQLAAEILKTKASFNSCVTIFENNNTQYLLRQNNICNGDSSATNYLQSSYFCSSGNSTGVSDIKLTNLVAYDKTTGLFYKNYFCAICNGIKNDSIDILTPTILCSIQHLDASNISSSQQICRFLYQRPENLRTFRSCNSQAFMTCDGLPNTQLLSSLNSSNNSINYVFLNEYRNLYASLCQLYSMPAILNLHNQQNNDSFSMAFQNPHCLKCWLIKKNLLNNYNVTITTINGTLLSVQTAYDDNYKNVSIDLDYQYLNNRSNDIIYEIPIKYRRKKNDAAIQYLLSQIDFTHLDGSNPINSYNFTLFIEFYLENELFKKLLNISDIFKLNLFEQSQIGKQIMDDLFVSAFLERYNLYQIVYGQYTTSITNNTRVDDLHDSKMNVYIPMRFNTSNVAVLNNKLSVLLQIISQLKTKPDYLLFKISKYTFINKIELFNKIWNYSADGLFCSLNNSTQTPSFVQYNLDLNTYLDNQLITYTKSTFSVSLNSQYVFRLNNINRFNNTNENNINFTDYQYKIIFNSSFNTTQNSPIFLNMCYNPTLTSNIFIDNQIMLNCSSNDSSLYILNDRLHQINSIVTINSNLLINFTVGDGDFSIEIENLNYKYLDTRVYLICIQNTTFDMLKQLLDKVISNTSNNSWISTVTKPTLQSLNKNISNYTQYAPIQLSNKHCLNYFLYTIVLFSIIIHI